MGASFHCQAAKNAGITTPTTAAITRTTKQLQYSPMTFPLPIALVDYHCAIAGAMRLQSPFETVQESVGGAPHLLQFPSSPSTEEAVHATTQEEPLLHLQPEPQFEEAKPDFPHLCGTTPQDEMPIIYKLQRFTREQDHWLLEITRGEPYVSIDWQNCAERFWGTFQQAWDARELNLEYLRLGSLKIEDERRRLMGESRDEAIGTGTTFYSRLSTAEIGEGRSTGEAMASLTFHGTVDVAPILGNPEVLDVPSPSCLTSNTIPDAGPTGDSSPNDSSEQIGPAAEELPLDSYELCKAVDDILEPCKSTEKTSSKRKRSPEPANFPRIVRTKTFTDTSVAMIAMGKAAPLDLQSPPRTLPPFQHSKLAQSMMQFLSALLSQPLDREVRIMCDSRSTIACLTVQAENTEKRVWLSPSTGFTRKPIGPNGQFEIQDLIHEILLTVQMRINVFGCRTWLEYQEDAGSRLM